MLKRDPRPIDNERIESKARVQSSAILYFFIFSLLIPIILHIGTLRLSTYRLVLLATIVPCIVGWLAGRSGRIRAPDLLLFGYVFWAMGSLIVKDSTEGGIQSAGILFIETIGPYLLARCFVRNEVIFESVVRVLFYAILLLIPFALIESVTGTPILLRWLGQVFPVFPEVAQHHIRWGLNRAQVVFEHPILYGVFCSSCFALSFYVLGYNRALIGRTIRLGLVFVATFLSMSSGPLLAVIAQAGLIGWELTTRSISRRWALLGALALSAYITVDVISNRTPIQVFIHYFTFDHHTAYQRINIWNYGMESVAIHPFLGIGLSGDWDRPSWLGASVDNFWLLITMRHGIPAVIFLGAAVLTTLFLIGRVKIGDKKIQSFRAGLLVCLAGFLIAGITVHYWNAVYCLFMFVMGSGIWILEANLGARLERNSPRGGLDRAKLFNRGEAKSLIQE